ncbi:MAG TPA: PadR family transcriptional regulator [Acidimicrobiia bacterium]|jgi:DNA-binding PadR family transcriptional regulator|nr:PadR family transcriptional regulator [Acidimicrobiia bacterium]
MLDLAVLGLLRRGPRHGYDLKRQLGDLGFLRVSFGALYPALRRLEKRGLIAALRPSARRKAYQLTDDGRIALDALLTDDGEQLEEDRRFQLRLAFFEYVEPDRRLAILKRRRSQLLPVRAEAGKVLRRAESTETDPYTRALVRHNVARFEADIAWLDDLIALARTDVPHESRRTT